MPSKNNATQFIHGQKSMGLPFQKELVVDLFAGARRVLEEMNGKEPGAYDDWDVELVSDEWLDKPWCDEDDRTKIVGTLREWLAAATEPAYLAGTE